MAAAAILFGIALATILVPTQDAVPGKQDVSSLLEKLGSADLAERDAAFVELKKLPLEKLPLVEPALSSSDPEVAGKAREAMAHVLRGALSRNLDAFEIRSLAAPKVMKPFEKDGKPPEGYEVFEADRIDAAAAVPSQSKLLVKKSPAFPAAQIKGAKLREGGGGAPGLTSAGGLAVDVELTEEGARTFETMAQQTALSGVVVAEGRVLHRVTLFRQQEGKYGAYARTKEDGERLVELLTGGRVMFTFVTAPAREGARGADDVTAAVKKSHPGATLAPDGRSLVVTLAAGAAPDLVGLWTGLRGLGWSLTPREAAKK
jgi:hypothetical protein